MICRARPGALACLVLGDLARDLSQLRRHGRISGCDTLTGVKYLVVFAAAWERMETMWAIPASRM